MDEAARERIRDDLRGLLKGELLFDELSRVLYSTDASAFEVLPLGVAVPRDEADVCALVRYAREHQVPLVPRGAGSGMAGEALGPGLVVDLSRHFRSILAVEGDTVRVQPGVILETLNARLAEVGRRFAPDPASETQCTLGGMLATNASGARACRHGYTRAYVEGLRAVLDNGDAVAVGRHPRPAPATASRLDEVVGATFALLEQHADVIRSCQPRTLYNRCGYLLHDVLAQGELDLARLLVGSEGTLALFTEATLRTVPLAGGRSLLLLGFPNLDAALRAAVLTAPTGPSACELLDQRLLGLARASTRSAGLVHAVSEAALLIEYEADTPRAARDRADELVARLQDGGRLATSVVIADKAEEVDRLWRLRETALPSLYGLRGGAQPVAFVEDVGVPLEALSEYLVRVQDVLQRHETTASFLVHAVSGQVHTRPFLDLRRPEGVAKMRAIADEVHGLAIELGGTVSTQHGTGLARTPYVERQYGPLAGVFRELKALFDPRGLFNPGKIVGTEGLGWPLRRPVDAPPRPEAEAPKPPPLTLRWGADELATEVGGCNGCGHCRTREPTARMCPIFRATGAEAATPRAKANLVRHLLLDADPGRVLSSDAVRDVADLCVNCKMCASECPAHVNVPKLMLEAKAANVAEHGLSRSDWVFSRAEDFAALGSALAGLANRALESGPCRWFLERFLGVSRRRRLPPFARQTFLQRAAHRGLTRPPRARRPRVAYFVDLFANYNDPGIGEAAAAVLQHNGVEVYVPPRQRGSGMALLACGDAEGARDALRENLRCLAEVARAGWPVVCSEPTAAVFFRDDAATLLNDPDVRLVAEQTVELTTYLWGLHRTGRLRTDFRELPLSVGHHVPCHVKALGPAVGPALLALIPGMRVRTIDVSCSGMAGTFGLGAENYVTSLEAGASMLGELARPGLLFGSTECSTCRMQMEEGTGKRTLHPVQYLALAYGLAPELARRLREPLRGWRQ